MRLLFALLLLAINCQAQRLSLSSNPDVLSSTGNDFGLFGAKEGLYSTTNDYGQLGSADSLFGASNDYGLGTTVKVIEPSFELIQVPLEVP